MVEPGLHRLLAPMAALIAMLCVVALAAGAAAPKSRATEAPLFIPGAFRLPASNGYTLYVLAEPARAGRSASLLVYATAGNRGVRYSVPATVTETSMQADLGALGRISVTFHPANQTETVTCHKRVIPFAGGQWEGEIHFQGEEGFTSADATAATGNFDYVRTELCGVFYSGTPGGGPQPGAELFLRNPGLGARLAVAKARPGAAAQIYASMSEYVDGISVARYVSLRMPGKGFTFDRRLRTATVRAPAPFAGSARYVRDNKAGQRWSGSLTVDMPGRSGVALTGPTLRAYLIRAG